MKISKTKFYLLIIFFLAFILRIIAAHSTHVSSDEMIYSIIPLNIISADRLGTIEQSPLFFYLTDLGYILLGGISAISVRLTAIIFGSLSTIIIFLIGKELWGEKTGLLSSFLFAISGYAIQFNYEMDMGAFFFSILAVYSFIKYFKEGEKWFYLSAISLALAILFKNIVALFIPAFAIVWIIWLIKNKKIKSSKNIKVVLVSVFLAFLILFPVFAYNYLTYQESGITDYYFSVVAGLGKTVHGGLETQPWSTTKLFDVVKDKFSTLFKTDFLLLFFGFLGILISLKTRTKETWLLFLSNFILFFYVGGQTGSASHYIWFPLTLSIFSGYGIMRFSSYLKSKFKFKNLIYVVILVGIISSTILISGISSQRDQSITLALRDYVREDISEDAIVVIDPRIYTGIHAWVFNDKHYLDGGHFNQLIQQISNSQEQKFNTDLYYIECAEGSNCGWKPEDFARIYDTGESLSNYFRENTNKVHEIRTDHNFNIYQGEIAISNSVYEAIDRTHIFWFYPIGWKYTDNVLDNYTPVGIGHLINLLGFILLWIGIILSIMAIPFTFYLGFSGD